MKNKVFIRTNTISNKKKVEIPDWDQMKVFSKGSQMVLNFVKFLKICRNNKPFKSASFLLIRMVDAAVVIGCGFACPCPTIRDDIVTQSFMFLIELVRKLLIAIWQKGVLLCCGAAVHLTFFYYVQDSFLDSGPEVDKCEYRGKC